MERSTVREERAAARRKLCLPKSETQMCTAPPRSCPHAFPPPYTRTLAHAHSPTHTETRGAARAGPPSVRSLRPPASPRCGAYLPLPLRGHTRKTTRG